MTADELRAIPGTKEIPPAARQARLRRDLRVVSVVWSVGMLVWLVLLVTGVFWTMTDFRFLWVLARVIVPVPLLVALWLKRRRLLTRLVSDDPRLKEPPK